MERNYNMKQIDSVPLDDGGAMLLVEDFDFNSASPIYKIIKLYPNGETNTVKDGTRLDKLTGQFAAYKEWLGVVAEVTAPVVESVMVSAAVYDPDATAEDHTDVIYHTDEDGN